jgi:ornithine cyclodeaminase/alanine dehydrogenase-like protein (mu-crystallin family)
MCGRTGLAPACSVITQSFPIAGADASSANASTGASATAGSSASAASAASIAADASTVSTRAAGAIRVIDLQTIQALVTPAIALASARRAFEALATDAVSQPAPLGWDVAGGDIHVKGAWLQGSPIFALKAATGFAANRDRGLPTSSGFVMIFDASTGQPCALLADDGYLTELRTGAAGALAASVLAVPRVRKIAMIGAGGQARFQLRAMAGMFEWQDTSVWSPHAERCAAYAQEMTAYLDRPVLTAVSAEDAVRDADVIVTTTPARGALIQEAWVKRGATVIAVGADSPGKQELDPLLLARADKVIVDLVRQASRLGELQHVYASGSTESTSTATVHGELGAVLTGQCAGRESEYERIVCDLTGTGAQDAAIAEAVWTAYLNPA